MRQIASCTPWLEICLALKRRQELYMPEMAQVLVKKLEISQKTFVILSKLLQGSYLHKLLQFSPAFSLRYFNAIEQQKSISMWD